MEHSPDISVVVIGGPDALIEATRRSSATVTAARLICTDVQGAATRVASSRPFALVISDELYGFDSGEFDALARDVQASIIAIRTDGVPVRALEERLNPRLLEAFRKHFQE
jgi:hypothetical protein